MVQGSVNWDQHFLTAAASGCLKLIVSPPHMNPKRFSVTSEIGRERACSLTGAWLRAAYLRHVLCGALPQPPPARGGGGGVSTVRRRRRRERRERGRERDRERERERGRERGRERERNAKVKAHAFNLSS